MALFLAPRVTGAETRVYERAARPKYLSQSDGDAGTRVKVRHFEIAKGRLGVTCLKGTDVLYEVDISWTVPPAQLSGGGTVTLTAEISVRDVSGQMSPDGLPEILPILSPDHMLSLEARPGADAPEDAGEDERAAGTIYARTLSVHAVMSREEERALQCGYRVRLPWGDDVHEVSVDYAYRKRDRWSLPWRKDRAAKPVQSSTTTDPFPAEPWLDQDGRRFFAHYVANLNMAIREERGDEWAVDAWGRELGPDSSHPVVPPGQWVSPSHYLWALNPQYDFYPTTVRAYVRKKFAAQQSP